MHYPTPASGWKGTVFSVVFGLFVTFFLWYFQPFGINLQSYSTLDFWIFGLISFSVFFVAHTGLPLMLPNLYKEKNWTIYRQIIFYVLLSFAIATFNGLFINYLQNLSFSWGNYLQIITQTFAVGILPITFYVLLSHYWMYRKIAEQSAAFNQQLEQFEDTLPRKYTIQSNIKNESFIIDEPTFLFAKSSGNYVEVFTSGQAPQIFRMGLTSLEEQLSESSTMIRCHRSYLVNAQQIEKASGNAQGLKLTLKKGTEIVPVSRKYIQSIRAVFAH
ncbi:MAG: LytTR family DNA-binding domain-containing protein [Bacteroidota bacterium]